MKIGILSDTHNQLATTARAIKLLTLGGAASILHCGDIEERAIVDLFVGTNAHFVFGNCDHHRDELRRAMQDCDVTLHEPYGQLELAGRSIAWIHGDDKRLFRELEASDRFDFLFYGHSHIAAEHTTGRTRVINPGALQRAHPKTCAILDLQTGECMRLTVAD